MIIEVQGTCPPVLDRQHDSANSHSISRCHGCICKIVARHPACSRKLSMAEICNAVTLVPQHEMSPVSMGLCAAMYPCTAEDRPPACLAAALQPKQIAQPLQERGQCYNSL